MKVLNLRCVSGHGFEGWFGSEAYFLDQHARGLIACPVCGGVEVQRLPSAPRLNLSGARAPEAALQTRASSEPGTSPSPVARPDTATPADVEVAYLQMVRHVLHKAEDVGLRFAEEARRIHHGEVENRQIRGQASPEEARALHDEGIEVVTLHIPAGLDRPLQ